MSLITSHFVGRRAALCGLERSHLRRDCRGILEWGLSYSKFHGIYVRKSHFMAPLQRRRKTNLRRISADMPPQMKILNTVVP